LGTTIREELFLDQSSYLGIRYYRLPSLGLHLEKTIP
jgi:hypothetical protein